jgi:hypothetical protein
MLSEPKKNLLSGSPPNETHIISYNEIKDKNISFAINDIKKNLEKDENELKGMNNGISQETLIKINEVKNDLEEMEKRYKKISDEI